MFINKILDKILDSNSLKRRINKDISVLRDSSYTDRGYLINLQQSELDIISPRVEFKKAKTGAGRIYRGVLKTIFHEHLALVYYKQYNSRRNQFLQLVLWKDHEFVYMNRGSDMDLFIDGHILGRMKNQETLVSHRTNKVIAKIGDKYKETITVKMENKEFFSIVNPEKSDTINPRAFEFYQKIESDKVLIFLSIAFSILINLQLSSKN